MGSNPIPCTKVSNLSKSYDVYCCVWEKVAFTESFTSLIFFIIFVALSMVKLVMFPSWSTITKMSSSTSEKSFRRFCFPISSRSPSGLNHIFRAFCDHVTFSCSLQAFLYSLRSFFVHEILQSSQNLLYLSKMLIKFIQQRSGKLKRLQSTRSPHVINVNKFSNHSKVNANLSMVKTSLNQCGRGGIWTRGLHDANVAIIPSWSTRPNTFKLKCKII